MFHSYRYSSHILRRRRLTRVEIPTASHPNDDDRRRDRRRAPARAVARRRRVRSVDLARPRFHPTRAIARRARRRVAMSGVPDAGDRVVSRSFVAPSESGASAAREIAARVHEAGRVAERAVAEKLELCRLACMQAARETEALTKGGIDNFALEETNVTSDGTSGSAAWMATCAMCEGAPAWEVMTVLESLVRFECDLNRVGNRVNHGKGISPLALLCMMLENKVLSPANRKRLEDLEMNADRHHDAAEADVHIQGAYYAQQVEEIRRRIKERDMTFTQSAEAIVDFATALLAAGADPNGVFKAQPETSDIADSRVAPYLGIPGTKGSPLFFCALAVISGAGDEVVALAGRLISKGASGDVECERPGVQACCGKFLTPFTVCCAALESSIAYEMSYSQRCRIATLASMILHGCADIKLSVESIFTIKPSIEELALRRIAPAEVQTTLSGPAVFILACAIAEGVGMPAMILMDALLRKTKNVGNVVGSRPHHGLRLPLLAMVIDAIDAPASFNANGFVSTREWWSTAAAKANVSDMGSILGSQLSRPADVRDLDSVDAGDAKSLTDFVPEINDAAFDGQGAVARLEAAETTRLRATQQEESAAAMEALDARARKIAQAIAAAERTKAQGQRNSSTPESEAESLADDEETLAAKGATQYTDENGDTFVVGYTDEMLQSGTGVFDIMDPEEMKRAMAKAQSQREIRAENLIKAAKEATFDIIDGGKQLLAAAEELGLGSCTDADGLFNRQTQARLDCIDLAMHLLQAGANPNVRMPLQREFSDRCPDNTATPLSMVCGYIVRGMTGLYPLLDALLSSGADVNARGFGPYPISTTAHFALALSVYHGVEGADVALEKLLKERNVVVDMKAVFPDGSKTTALIQLIHALRAGKSDRKRVLQLIEMLTSRGADPNLCCVEVYSENIPEAYIEAMKLNNYHAPPVAFFKVPEITMVSTRAEENAQVAAVVERLRNFPSSDLVPSEPGHHKDLSDIELKGLDFGRIFDEVTRLRNIKDADGEVDEASIRSSMFGSVKNFDFGAPFPALPHRSGECEYPPLFWAIEAAAKEGHAEALELVTRLLNIGADVRYMMGKNFHSWVEGSLVAMSVMAAVEAAAPLPAMEEEAQFDKANVGEILLRLNQAAATGNVEDAKRKEILVDNNIEHALETENASKKFAILGEDWPDDRDDIAADKYSHVIRAQHTDADPDVIRRGAVLNSLVLERPDDRLAYTVQEVDDDEDAGLLTKSVGHVTRSKPAKLSMVQGVLRPEGSRFGPKQLAARRDIPGLVRTVVIGHTSMESRALDLARKENERRADALRQRAVNINSLAEAVSEHDDHTSDDRSQDANVAEDVNEASSDSSPKIVDTKALEFAIAEQDESAEREIQSRMNRGAIVRRAVETESVDGHAAAKRLIRPARESFTTSVYSDTSRKRDANDAVALASEQNAVRGGHWPSDDDFEDERSEPHQTEMEKLYAEADDLGPPSEQGEDSPPTEWEATNELTREELELRHASRAKTTLAIAVELLERSGPDNIDAFGRNPLLENFGVGLVPYEYTPLFAALYGAATAKSQEQLAVGITLAKVCLNKGANVMKVGCHSILAPGAGRDALTQLKQHRKARFKQLRERYDGGDSSVLTESLDDEFKVEPETSVKLRSYPLMWAVTAAIRAESRELGCEDIVRHMLMEGADPTSISLDPVHARDGADARSLHGSVLYLWGTDEDLWKASQKRYQQALSVRLNISRMLSESGARSTYRVKSNMTHVASTVEAAASGRWLIKGKEGYGIVAAPPANTSKVDTLEPFSARIARALHSDGTQKRHVVLESTHEQKVDAISRQGASETVSTWMYPGKDDSQTPPPEDDNLSFRFTSELGHVHHKREGEIEVVRFEGGSRDDPGEALRSYDVLKATSMAESKEAEEESIIRHDLRRMQLSAIRRAFAGTESDVPKTIIEDTLLPPKLLK